MKYLITYFFIITVFVLTSCARPPSTTSIERVQPHMGTYARIQINNGNNDDIDAAFNEIKELDNLLSDYNPDSQISEINKMAGVKPVEVDPQVIEVLKLAKEVAIETDGIFDPTIGALTIGVYRFGRDNNEEINIQEIETAKSLVNYKDLIIIRDKVYLKRKGMMLDLGGIGKGFAVQKAVDVLKEREVMSGVVALSGDIKVFGQSIDVSIQDPGEEGGIASFRTQRTDLAISTSGSYERVVDIDGEIYHHLILPESGLPEDEFLSITVVMDGNSALADAYATALFVMGKEKALEFTSKHQDIGVFIVFPDKNIYYNDTFSDLVNDIRILRPTANNQ